ncbi:MAG TPA: hypothetical protein VIW68_13260 [Candidatus Sulfotelmatobacter sp.]
METQLPPDPASPQIAATPLYRDRSTGLIIFGILEIAFGALCALMIPFMLLGAAFSHKIPGGGMPAGTYVSGICTYTFIAAGLITLGIGSIRARRWSRALNLILAWVGLVGGTTATIAMSVLLPSTFVAAFRQAAERAPNPQPLSTGVAAVILTVMIVFFAVFLVVVPLAFLLFFRMKDVEETCRQRDPIERWTDHCPLPVLAVSLLFACGATYSVLVGITTPVFPFFGTYLGGAAAGAGLIAVAVLDVFLAVWLYRLRALGWWIAMGAFVFRLSSTVLTYRRADLLQLYSKMGWSQDQLQMMNNNPMIHSSYMLWFTLVGGLAFLGYMLWIKRYFGAPVTPNLVGPQTAYEAPSSGTI